MAFSEAEERLIKKKRLKLVKDFAEHTSAHGCILVHRSNTCRRRTFWTIAIAFAWSICLYQIYIAVNKYFQYSTQTSVRIRHLTNVTFPAVTICNLNPIRNTWLLEHYDLFAEIKQLDEVMNFTKEDWERDRRAKKPADYITKEQKTIYKNLKLIYDKNINVTEAGHSLEDMLIDCTFQSSKCTAANFTRWQHGTYGNCYTIIVARDQFSSFIGPFYGLSLTLYVDDKEYLLKHSPAAGFRVQVHPVEYVPFPEDEGFTISPGVVTSVAVKQVRISRMPFPYDGTDCGDIDKTHLTWANSSIYQQSYEENLEDGGAVHHVLNYTTQACVKSCYQRRLVQDCGCVDASFITRDQAKFFADEFNMTIPDACEMVYEEAVQCVRHSLSQTTELGLCEKDCPQSCHEQDYVARITTALWPRTSYYKSVRDEWRSQVKTMKMMKEADEARTNVVKLEVYFEELNYQSITETPAMDIFDLLSNIGGTLGLYVGMSFLTLGEFFELFMKCLAVAPKAKLRSRASMDDL
ncbi:hypothetical protein QR680_001280 [Steinernema hermaphroditum]|uniref:Amiloride-sensitive sodium channel n=1 Tax=Steinernema hermaphroditum TaxID=289476 RepID=A0AA39GXK7_9BILA|nr:hypothetical protein QR680_001280 [Steinernema hermaphroditum]